MKTMTIEDKKNWVREHGLVDQVAELNRFAFDDLEVALDYVIDAHTLTKAEFIAKYF